MSTIRVAKADENDFERVYNLLRPLQLLFGNKWSDEESWSEWDDDDPDKLELLKIRKAVADEEGYDPEDVDNRLVLFEFIKRRYKKADCGCWQRVVMSAECLIDSVCDPQKDYLDWHPYLVRATADSMLGE